MGSQPSASPKVVQEILLLLTALCLIASFLFHQTGRDSIAIGLFVIPMMFASLVYSIFIFVQKEKLKLAVPTSVVILSGVIFYFLFDDLLIFFLVVLVGGLQAVMIVGIARWQAQRKEKILAEIRGKRKVGSLFKIALAAEDLWKDLSPARAWALVAGICSVIIPAFVLIWMIALQFPVNPPMAIVVAALLLPLASFAGMMIFMSIVQAEVYEKKMVESELKVAHDMQMGLMPKEDPIVPGFDISGICLPANDVGGDFFDYVWLDGKRRKLGIAVADVSGKAMKAAITAVMTSGMIYREAGGNESPKAILRNMNRPMYTKLDSRMFTALSFAVIDTRKKELRFSNAGQSYPLLKRGKEVKSLEVKGARLPLGVKEDVTYGEMAVKLKKGDTLIFYTDGIPEAKDQKDEFYGFERFKSLMENLGGLLAKEMRDRILSEVKLFTGNAPQHDDMTVVVVKVN